MRSLGVLFIGVVAMALLVACHGAAVSPPVVQGHHGQRSRFDIVQDNPSLCVEISTPSPSWATYTCYLKPNANVTIPSPDVVVSPAVTADTPSCSRIDRVSVTITTGSTPLPNFDPVTVTAHETLNVCDSINCASQTNTGGQINLH